MFYISELLARYLFLKKERKKKEKIKELSADKYFSIITTDNMRPWELSQYSRIIEYSC